MDLFEGKDKPPKAPMKAQLKLGKTFGLCLRLENFLKNSGSVVVIDSGFCVLKLILETMNRGVCVSVLIKIGDIGLKGSMEALLTINSGPKYWVCGMYKL